MTYAIWLAVMAISSCRVFMVIKTVQLNIGQAEYITPNNMEIHTRLFLFQNLETR